ncbi:MAG: radical SAM protein [Chloroflexota bacterium]|nr:radical SAM protein [Chloroflexota bacterium]
MNREKKVEILGRAAQYDICRGCGTDTSRRRDEMDRWIYPAVRPDGKRVSMLKVLQTNACANDCAYCVNRSQRDTRRVSFSSDELARIFDEMARANMVEGLFLSSGIWGNASQAMERMLATVELVRKRYEFGGYVHLKILPGADDASIEAAISMADRVSVNLEVPNAQRIGALSNRKDFRQELLAPLRKADEIRRQQNRRVSMTTQFVVGAAGESDRELVTSAAWLYRNLHLARAYYSAFQPIRDTPLENHPATPTWREHRLYQADFLLRQYDFCAEEFIFDQDGHLPREADPKLLWARHHPEQYPLEINTASRERLLRIPGIGPVSADKILKRRQQGTLRGFDHAGLSPALARRAAPFVLFDGKRPSFQLSMW